jgi:glycosyltransferase involved in cell wall biosynthesis
MHKRVLFVFSWLVVGGEETEVRLLAQNLDPARYRLEVVACFRKPGMPEQTHEQLQALGVPVDRTPYDLSFEDTVAYLTRKIEGYDLVVGCQAVRDLYPALERMEHRPPLIEHGGLVCEALAGPKHLTARYVGVCASIRDAAAGAMPGRPQHALEIPSMVDLSEFKPNERLQARLEWGVTDETPVIGWVGRLDRKKRVEDFIRAAAIVHEGHPEARFLVIGGPDAFMPEYEGELRSLTTDLGLDGVLSFLGDRPDVPRLMSGLDVLVWLSKGEGMPHVISEAGAACLPVVATRDNGTEEQITGGVTGLFVPHEHPPSVAAALDHLLNDPDLRHRLGSNLRGKVEREYSAQVIARRWQELFDEVIAEAEGEAPVLIHRGGAEYAEIQAH